MRVKATGLTRLIALTLLSVVVARTASAQFGHPLKGTWSGEWGTNQTHVVLELNWDGKQITGTINPGPNGAAIKVATLDASTWAVHLEADGKDRSGAAVHYVVDGKLDNLGAYRRFITGTWTEGSAKGAFKIVRN